MDDGSDSCGSLDAFVVGDDETPIRATATQNPMLDSSRATVDDRPLVSGNGGSYHFTKPVNNQFNRPLNQFDKSPKFAKPVSQVTTIPPKPQSQFSQSKPTEPFNPPQSSKTPIIKEEFPPNQFQQHYTPIIKKQPPVNQFAPPPNQPQQHTRNQFSNQSKQPNTPIIVKKEFVKPNPPSQFVKPRMVNQFTGGNASGLSFQPPPKTSQFGGKKIERLPTFKAKQSGGLGGGAASWKK
jgi:hypothetical protein